MYESLQLPWSPHPSEAETRYRQAGLVKTKGTLFLLPPSTEELRAAYNAPPRPRTRMSAGAVALCKHFERGGASSEHGRPHPFWVLPTGGNENKSAIAGGVLEDMLTQAVWRNVLLVHAGVAVYEVRNGRGWGMRWSLEVQEAGEDLEGDEEHAGGDEQDSTGNDRGRAREDGDRKDGGEEDRGGDVDEDDQMGTTETGEDDNEGNYENEKDQKEGGLIEEDKKGEIDGDKHGNGEQAGDDCDVDTNWVIIKTTFRGFLEPIKNLDHELPL